MESLARARHLIRPTGCRWTILLIAGAACLGGCSGNKHEVVYRDTQGIPSRISADSCAIGGMVMYTNYGLDHLSGVDIPPEEFTRDVQSDLWAPVLESVFWQRAGKAPAVDWLEWKRSIPEYSRDRMLYYLSRHTLIPPDILEECSELVPQARWMLMVTIDHSKFELDIYEGFAEQHAYARWIWLQLEIYDLKRGHSVYTSRMMYKGEGPKSPASSTEVTDRSDYAGLPGSASDYIATNVLSGPPLRPTLDEALVKLLSPVLRRDAYVDPDDEVMR